MASCARKFGVPGSFSFSYSWQLTQCFSTHLPAPRLCRIFPRHSASPAPLTSRRWLLCLATPTPLRKPGSIMAPRPFPCPPAACCWSSPAAPNRRPISRLISNQSRTPTHRTTASSSAPTSSASASASGTQTSKPSRPGSQATDSPSARSPRGAWLLSSPARSARSRAPFTLRSTVTSSTECKTGPTPPIPKSPAPWLPSSPGSPP